MHNVSDIRNHPYFSMHTFDYDMALLKLATRIKIDDYRKQEISLPFYGEIIPEKTPVLVSGWGEKVFNDVESKVTKVLKIRKKWAGHHNR